jgi:tRNA threonylcarbamoyl adenosine modification protein YeaZ
MLVLGIESATPVASVALADETGLLGEVLLNVGLTHSEQLLPMIDDLLRQCRRVVGDVTAVGVSAGPGSFTGLRIGMATAKAIAQGLSAARAVQGGEKAALFAIPTLEAMAWQTAGQAACVSPMLNARRGQIYTGLYRWRKEVAAWPKDAAPTSSAALPDSAASPSGAPSPSGAARQRGKKERLPADAGDIYGMLECVIPPEAASPEAWAARLKEGAGSVYLLGEGAAMYKEIWARDVGDNAVILPPFLGLCRGSFVALAAMDKMGINGTSGINGTNGANDRQDYYSIKPVYLRGI